MTEWDHGAAIAPPAIIFDVSWFQVAKILRERSIFADTSQAWWMTSHSELQRLVVELEVSFWGLLNYESDGSTTNLTSCKVFFCIRMNFQREWCSTDNTVLAQCHRNKVHFLVEPCVGALLQNEICSSFHFHILDSRGSTIFSVEVRHACIFVTMTMCRSNILKVLYWNMHAGQLL